MGSIAVNPAIAWPVLIIGGAVGLFAMVEKAWSPVRRFVAMMDVVVGRPARYVNDPEEKPGIVKRLDDIDRNVCKLDQRVTGIERHITNPEEK